MKIYNPTSRHHPVLFTEMPSAWGDIPTIILDIIERFNIKRNKCLEFGVEYGYSTSAFSNYFKEVIGVDTFEGDTHSGYKQDHLEKTRKDLEPYQNIKLIKSTYQDFIKNNNNNQYDLIHVDIIHNYQETFECGEWSLFHSNITLFHDTESYPEVKKVCEDLASKYNIEFYNYPDSHGLGILKYGKG